MDSTSGTSHPSQDPIKPEQSKWLREELERQGKPTQRQHANAAMLQRLAARRGVPAEELAERIPEDTLRRMKYPALEQEEPDGTRTFKHDVGVSHEVKSLVATDHTSEPIEQNAPRPRDERGRYTK